MRDILLPVNRAVLGNHSTAAPLLAFDFDGTLAPISRFRDAVAMRPSTTALLRQACSLFACVVVSGRGRADVVARLEGVPFREVIGNHGLEPSDKQLEFEAWTTRALPVLQRALTNVRGIEIENKRFSITLHYSPTLTSVSAARLITRAIAHLDERPRMIGGKLVVNVIPPNAPHKGTALEAFAVQAGASHVMYIGDDETDEDVFRSRQLQNFLAIRVGRASGSAAAYYVRDQVRVDDLLRSLIEARTRSRSCGT